MGIFDFLFSKKETQSSCSTHIPTSVSVPHQLETQEQEPVKPELQQEATITKVAKFTEKRIWQMVDYLAKEQANYTKVIYEDNFGDIDLGRLDPLFEDAARLIVIHQQGSTSLIQRKLAIGYNRAGRIMEMLEKAEVVGPAQGSQAREVLCCNENDLEFKLDNLDNDSFIPQDALSKMSKEEFDSFKNDHSEEIENRVQHYQFLIEEEKKKIIRQEIEEEKARIKEEMAKKKKARDIRAAAMKELVDEGILDSDYIKRRETIPQDIQDAVWNRDSGRCVKCGSQENLEFDHIIPFSKGGSTTIRNLQILCKKCNLEKSNKIG